MGYFQYQTVDSWGWFWEVHTTASWISWGHPSMPWIVPWIGLDEWHCRLRQRCPERHAPPWTSAFPMLGIESIGEDCRVWGPLRSLEVPRVPRIWWRSHGNGTYTIYTYWARTEHVNLGNIMKVLACPGMWRATIDLPRCHAKLSANAQQNELDTNTSWPVGSGDGEGSDTSDIIRYICSMSQYLSVSPAMGADLPLTSLTAVYRSY